MRWFCFPAVSLKALFLSFRNPWLFLNHCCYTSGILGVCPDRWFSSRAIAFCLGGPALSVLLLSPFPFMRLFTSVSIPVKTQDKFLSSKLLQFIHFAIVGIYLCTSNVQFCPATTNPAWRRIQDTGLHSLPLFVDLFHWAM